MTLQIDRLYPAVDFPVSQGTPSISPLIKWNHDRSWAILQNKNNEDTHIQKTIVVNLSDEEYEYINGYKIDGKRFNFDSFNFSHI